MLDLFKINQPLRLADPCLAGAGLLLLLGGCASGPAAGSGSKYVLFPSPPAAPRVQYLTSFAGGKDPDTEAGKFAEYVTGDEASVRPIVKPYGLTVASNALYICDTSSHAVDVLDLGQGTLQYFSPVGSGKLGVPINVIFDTDGSRYVTDTARNQVLCYDAAGQYAGALDEAARLRPTGIALTLDRIYVSDLNSHCIRVYAKRTRQFLATIPPNPAAAEDVEPGKLYMPVNLALDRAGRIYVSDLAVCQVKMFDALGRFVKAFGAAGDLPGQFARPKGITVDRAGRVLVVDAASQTCQIFDGEGKLLLPFGEPDAATAGRAGTLNLPAAVCVDYDHIANFQKFAAPGFVIEELIFITNQLGPDKVSVFALGHKE